MLDNIINNKLYVTNVIDMLYAEYNSIGQYVDSIISKFFLIIRFACQYIVWEFFFSYLLKGN